MGMLCHLLGSAIMPSRTCSGINPSSFVRRETFRKTDEYTVIYYLQKFSDDRFIAMMTKRITDAELLELFEFINRLLKTHLTESEYHTLFLKEDQDPCD